jgi:cell migration-inducing and hyaluronan-binding protein
VGSAHPTVFLPGKTYYVFFVYAKPTTHQTYDIYVGKDEDLKVTPVLGYLPGSFKFSPFPSGTWVTTGPYNATTGTVHITVDLKNEQAAFDNSKYAPNFNFCQPSTFCGVKTVNNKQTCGCNPNNPRCTDDAVCAWGEKQLDCPFECGWNPSQMQCYGFSFTMPGDFTVPTPNNTPDPTLFVAYTTIRTSRKGWELQRGM